MRAKKLAILLLSVALAAMLTGCPWDQDEPSGSSSGSSSSSSSSRPDDGGDEGGGSSGSSSSSSSSSQPEAPVVESIRVQAGKTDYFYGEAVDPATLTVTAVYSDGSEETVTDYTVSPEKFEATGTQTVTVAYTSPAGDEFTATFDVTVHAKLMGISVSPGSLECFVNEPIEDALTVTAAYNDGSKKTVTGYTVSPDTFSAAGPQTATVTYVENGVEATAELSVTVKDKLTGISVVEKNKKEYDLYDSINKDDLTVTAHYIAGGDVTLNSSDFTVSPAEFTGEPGTQTVTVTYTENGVKATAEFTVTVNDPGYRITGNTYEVHTTEGLLAWNKAVQKNAALNCTLTADIDLAGETWTPVGSSFTSDTSYQGTFDGQGHRIKGLTIITNSSGGESAALFDYIGSNGTVKNLQVEVNYNVQQNGAAGGIAYANYGTITACSVTGNITASSGAIGGIAVNNFGTITACWFNGNLTTKYDNGGIAGYNYGTITACYYGGNSGHGANNQGGTVDATKVEGDWADAVEGMNAALGSNDYEWKLTGNTPTLASKTSETILGRLEQLASHLR